MDVGTAMDVLEELYERVKREWKRAEVWRVYCVQMKSSEACIGEAEKVLRQRTEEIAAIDVALTCMRRSRDI